MKKGFTLLELIIVIIIIGVLSAIGFAQYTKLVEKSRTSEAKALLGDIRTAQEAYKLQYGVYTADIADLPVEVPTDCLGSKHYFKYGVDITTGTATRCIVGGKPPEGPSEYEITLTYDGGVWGGTAGYY